MAIKTLDLYLKQPNNVYGNYYYIHLHKQNIGRMAGGSPKTDADMVKIFSSYKRSSAKALKKQYTGYLIGSMIDLTPGGAKVIEEALDVSNNSSDRILQRLHDALKTGFESQFDNRAIIAAMQKQQELIWSPKKNPGLVELDKLFQSNGRKGDKIQGFAVLDKILQVLEETCKLLNSDSGNMLAVILSEQRQNGYNATKELGRHLEAALNQFIKDNKEGAFLSKDLEEGIKIATEINNFSTALKNNKTSSSEGKLLSTRSLQSILQNSVFPMISELFVNQLQEAAINIPSSEMAKFIANSIKMSGADTSFIQYTAPDGTIVPGQYLRNYGLTEGKEQKSFGKADSLVDVLLEGESITGKYHGTIKLSVGISTKAYASNKIGTKLNQSFDNYSLGKGLNLGQAFSLIPNLSTYHRYLGYNLISHDTSEDPNTAHSLIALQDVLLTRGLAYLASGRGISDSAQLLFLNGNIMSMWDIIKYAMDNNIGASGSLLKTSSTTGIYMTLEKRKDIIQYASSLAWSQRLINTNNAINSAVIKLEIVPKKILDYMVINKRKT